MARGTMDVDEFEQAPRSERIEWSEAMQALEDVEAMLKLASLGWGAKCNGSRFNRRGGSVLLRRGRCWRSSRASIRAKAFHQGRTGGHICAACKTRRIVTAIIDSEYTTT